MFFFHFIKIVIFQVVRGVEGQKMVQSEKNSVCHTPYLRNNTWYDFHLCIYGANDNIFRKIFFLILSRFWFSRFLGEVGLKGKKQSLKNSVRCTLYLRNHTSYDFHLWYTSVSWWYLNDFFFFFFFQNFVFSVKRRKMVQNEKRFCLLNSISQNRT